MVTEKGKRESSTSGNVQGEHFPQATGWENEGGWAELQEFLQPKDLRTGVLKVRG